MVAPQKRQTFNNGTEGALVTNSNTATSGDAISAPTVAGTGAAVFGSSGAIRGARGCHVTGVVGDTYTLILTGTASPSGSAQVYFTVDSANPPGTAGWIVVRLRSASATSCNVTLSTGRVLQVQNTSGTTLKNMNSNTALADGSYCVNLQATHGASTTDGTVLAELYNNAGTLIDTYSASNVAAGTADITQVQAGKVASGGSIDAWIDELAFSTGTTAEIDLVPANLPPTVNAGVDQNVAPGAAVSLAATAADTDGTVTAISWSVIQPSTTTPTLSGGATLTPTFTANATGGHLTTLQCTVTDNNGATASDTVEVRTTLTGSANARPLALDGTGVGTWTKQGGSSTDGAALADESDATFLESTALTATETTRRCRIQGTLARATGAFKLKLSLDTGGPVTATVRMYEGTTLRQTWTQSVTTTVTEYTFNLSGGTVSAVGDWSNVYAEVAGSV
jgi:hypothetical protein